MPLKNLATLEIGQVLQFKCPDRELMEIEGLEINTIA